MKPITMVLATSTLLLLAYSIRATTYVVDMEERNDHLLAIICITQKLIDKANPLDPAIAKLQVMSWEEDDLCKDYQPEIVPENKLPASSQVDSTDL